jgi:Concanavalin A-like lectin/glucanases superfamily
LVRALGILSALLLLAACNPGDFDELVRSAPPADAGALDGASPPPGAAHLDARATMDARDTRQEPADASAVDAAGDASVADAAALDAALDAAFMGADAGQACFAAGSSLVSYFRLDGAPVDAVALERGGASVVAVGAEFGVGVVGSALRAGELAISQSRLDAPSALTISAWLRLESAPTGTNAAWLWKGGDSGEDLTTGYWLVIAGPSFRSENARYLAGTPAPGHLGFAITNGTEEQFLLTDEPFPLLRYVHVVATFDGSRARLYLDGSTIRDEPQSVLARATTSPLRLASPLGGAVAPLSGQLDEVALFDRALSPSEVNDLYQHAGVSCVP